MSQHSENDRHNSEESSVMENCTSGRTSGELPQRRLIKPDITLLYGLDKDDESDDEVQGVGGVPTKDSLISAAGSLYYGHICPDKCQSEPVSPSIYKPLINESKKDEEGDEAFMPPRVDLRRRHSISDPSHTKDHGSTMITFPFEYTNNTLKVKTCYSLSGPSVSPILHRRKTQLPRSVSKSILQEEFFQSNHWQTAMECLSLNLEEVVHIRNVLTKAELEGLPVDCSTKEDVEKGKICFLCLKARFSLFGPWGNQCKLCKRMVCTKCCSKMRIPTDHFAKIPVSTLSPLLSPRDEDYSLTPSKSTPTPQKSPGNGSIQRKSSLGSAPTSPTPSRKSIGTDSDSGQRSISPGLIDFSEERDRFSPDSQNGPYSLPTVSAISSGIMAFKKRGFGVKKDSEKTERLRGALMVVCHDCKAMVLQIIRSSRVKKANNLRANLSLNLPVTTLPQIVA